MGKGMAIDGNGGGDGNGDGDGERNGDEKKDGDGIPGVIYPKTSKISVRG